MEETQQPRRRRKDHTEKQNAVIAMVFHGILIGAIVLLAAHDGILGEKAKQFTAAIIAKEKPVEKPKPPPKPPAPKIEDKPKDQPKAPAPVKFAAAAAPAPVNTAPQRVVAVEQEAPDASVKADFVFTDGATSVQTGSNPIEVYRGMVESALRSRWVRPDGTDDQTFVAEVEVALAADGQISAHQIRKASGNAKWDDSVKQVFSRVRSLGRPPPQGFPQKMMVRFDVEVENALSNN
ncbi:MAG: TonB C-terminal domain-containing protein [Verrucomicrobia bacterium]|nr:TonB C-terminal domain-containing protein [Verrucomicrobiota bacterium]